MDGIRDASASAAVERAAQPIVVEVASSARLAEIAQSSWADLLDRAAIANVFMDPVLLQAAAQANPDRRIVTLLAWRPLATRRQLVGTWAFAIDRAPKSALPINVLMAPPCPNSYLASPVIDRTCLDDVLDAMLDTLDADRTLPKIAALDAMPVECPIMEALTRVLAARGSAPCVFDRFQRSMLVSELDGKHYLERALSGSSRKKLRQHRRRLAEQGTLTSRIISEPEAVSRALESFLTIEAAGWKGRHGTAVLCRPAHAAFMRGAVGALAARGAAWAQSLELDGRPISVQIIVRSGPAAFTWKTAYDEAFRDFSPGMLLFEDYTAALLADRSIAVVDSCTHDESSFMAVWSERQPIADMWIDTQRGGSVAFRLLARLQQSYRELRAFAKNSQLAPAMKRLMRNKATSL